MSSKEPVDVQEITGIREIIERLLKEKDSYYDKAELRAVLKNVISKIEDKIAEGGYIYRGEPECYKVVSSTLYRQRYHKDNIKHFKYAPKEVDLAFLEDSLVELAQRHHRTSKSKSLTHTEVLDEIQHWGGETNCIDFSKRLEVALFFACFGSYDKDGRVILKKKKSVVTKLRQPKGPETRVTAQKSVFIVEPSGVIEPDDEIVIPSKYKFIILKCLNRLSPPINVYAIYGDIFGFVRFSKEHRDVYFRFVGAFSQTSEAVLSDSSDKNKFRKSIEEYKELAKKMPFISDIHRGCGIAHGFLKETDDEINCFREALSWQPDDYESMSFLGMAYLDKMGISSDISERKSFANKSLSIFNKVIPKKKNEPDLSLVGCYTHRGKVHINLGNYQLAIHDFYDAIHIIQSNSNTEETSDTPIIRRAKCEACYFFAEALLCWDSNEPLGRLKEKSKTELIQKITPLNKFETAKKLLTDAKNFEPSIYKKIVGPIIGRQGFEKRGIELPDDIADLLLPPTIYRIGIVNEVPEKITAASHAYAQNP